MSCNCCNPYKAECGNICDGFVIDIIAPVDATYSIVADYLGGQIKIDTTTLAGDKPTFDLSQINPFYIYTFAVLLNGIALSFTDIDLVEYQCFELRAKPYGAAFVTTPLIVI